jgi:formylglycine-generating enzyme required for sulfatase activity
MAIVIAASGMVIAGCGGDREREPARRTEALTSCPERMTRVPGREDACIDRHEARIVEGRAVAAIDAPAADELTWFEADDACRRAGLRLCSIDEHERACAGADRARRYPYGDEHEPHRCNTAERDDDLGARAVQASGSFPECVTPEGVFDLSGNALEWLADEGRGGGLRGLRGGSAFQPASSSRCVSEEGGFLVPGERAGGFRCCVSLTR